MVTCQSLELVTRHPDGFVSNLPADSDSDDAVATTRTPSRTRVTSIDIHVLIGYISLNIHTYPCTYWMYLSDIILEYPYISMYLWATPRVAHKYHG